MSYVLICAVAFIVSGLTLFSGFGLGTVLMPAFALFFPVEVAVAATAVVHLANNIFKVFLVGRRADVKVVAAFAVPAAVFAAVGAALLGYFATLKPLVEYAIGGRQCQVTVVKLVIAVLVGGFAVLDLIPRFENLAVNRKYIPLGGALSGFFGGLSGIQGALRSVFLLKAGLGKESFVGTVVLSAVIVDISRLSIYGMTFFSRHLEQLRAGGGIGLVVAGSLAAFLGAFLGAKLLKKITMKTVKIMVGVMLLAIAAALGTGIV
ncbi:MAG: TSUP family transporter [Planctomycetota bacterium]